MSLTQYSLPPPPTPHPHPWPPAARADRLHDGPSQREKCAELWAASLEFIRTAQCAVIRTENRVVVCRNEIKEKWGLRARGLSTLLAWHTAAETGGLAASARLPAGFHGTGTCNASASASFTAHAPVTVMLASAGLKAQAPATSQNSRHRHM